MNKNIIASTILAVTVIGVTGTVAWTVTIKERAAHQAQLQLHELFGKPRSVVKSLEEPAQEKKESEELANMRELMKKQREELANMRELMKKQRETSDKIIAECSKIVNDQTATIKEVTEKVMAAMQRREEADAVQRAAFLKTDEAVRQEIKAMRLDRKEVWVKAKYIELASVSPAYTVLYKNGRFVLDKSKWPAGVAGFDALESKISLANMELQAYRE